MNWPWRRAAQREQDLEAEIRSHLDMARSDRIARGQSEIDAERSLRREFGNVELVKELTRDVWTWTFLEQLAKDLRYAFRLMLRNPKFTSVAILTLALGIGANSAIFSMVNALILRPYTFRDLDRLALLRQSDRGEVAVESLMTAADATDLAQEVPMFDALTIYRFRNLDLSKEREVNSALGVATGANFFDLLGERPLLGRTWTPGEDQPGSDKVAVLGYGLWKSRFGGDPNIVGKAIGVDGQSCTIIGVMPSGFSYPVPVQIWIPLTFTPDQRADRKNAVYTVLGRLKTGVSVAQAGSALQGFSKRLQQRYPATNSGRSITIVGLRQELYRFTIPLFGLLEVAALFVLALACANLMNLLMARMMSREKELAVRTALGANRGRLAQLIVMESVLLSVAAGAIALTVAYWSVEAIRVSISQDYTQWIPGWDRIRVDPRVVVFGLLISMAVGLFVGLVTAGRGAQADPYPRLKEGGRAGMSASKHRLRNALVVLQMVIAMVLLVGATLMIQGFLGATNLYQSLRPQNVLIFEVSLAEKRYPSNSAVLSFFDRTLQELRSLPGVQAATAAANLPASNVENDREPVRIEGHPTVSVSEMPAADIQTAGPQFLEAIGIPLVRGRELAMSDSPASPKVVMISQTAAEQFWPQQDPIGRRLKFGATGGDWLTVIGVCGDVKQNWWNRTPAPTLYLPYAQSPRRSMRIAMRAGGNPLQYAHGVREILQRIDAQLAIHEIHPYEKEVADSLALVRVIGILMTIFGALALTLAAVGLYGLVAYSVSQRTHEYGIRLTLGAARGEVLRRVLGESLVLAGIGVAFGLPLSFVVGKIMGSAIFGLVQFQALVLIAFAALMVLTSLAASFFPALRAMRVDPIVALRYE
jgi:putative ABC transport system permease protein